MDKEIKVKEIKLKKKKAIEIYLSDGELVRGILFDSSTIPKGATIISANLNINSLELDLTSKFENME